MEIIPLLGREGYSQRDAAEFNRQHPDRTLVSHRNVGRLLKFKLMASFADCLRSGWPRTSRGSGRDYCQVLYLSQEVNLAINYETCYSVDYHFNNTLKKKKIHHTKCKSCTTCQKINLTARWKSVDASWTRSLGSRISYTTLCSPIEIIFT